MISFKTPEEIFASPPIWLPAQIQFSNYMVLFKDGDAWTVWNSLVIATSSTIMAMLFGTMCAYSIARFKTGGQNFAMWVISNRMIPPIVVVFPDLSALCEARLGRQLFRPDPALYRL